MNRFKNTEYSYKSYSSFQYTHRKNMLSLRSLNKETYNDVEKISIKKFKSCGECRQFHPQKKTNILLKKYGN